MSNALSWAIRDLEDRDMTASQQNILFVLESCIDKKGCCWYSIDELAKKCHLSRRAMQYNMQFLIDKGYVRRVYDGGNGQKDPPIYVLDFMKIIGEDGSSFMQNLKMEKVTENDLRRVQDLHSKQIERVQNLHPKLSTRVQNFPGKGAKFASGRVQNLHPKKKREDKKEDARARTHSPHGEFTPCDQEQKQAQKIVAETARNSIRELTK